MKRRGEYYFLIKISNSVPIRMSKLIFSPPFEGGVPLTSISHRIINVLVRGEVVDSHSEDQPPVPVIVSAMPYK